MFSLRPPAAVAALVAAVLAAAPAAADTRIFSVKTNAPGVTAEQAFLGGKELPIAGRGDDNTLFRIDSPDAAVPCANHLSFVTSNGEKVDLAADLCALNWDVTLQVRAASAPPSAPVEPAAAAETPAAPPPPAAATDPAPAPAPAAEAAGGAFSQTVTISTSDPNVAIDAVFLEAKPFAIVAREGSAVKIAVAGDDKGITCQRDLGLTLSDGRRLSRSVNICLNDFRVAVALTEDGDAVVPPPEPATPPPASPDAAAAPAPVAPATPPPVPSAVVAAPPGTEPGSAWLFSAAGATANLVFGIPETDSAQFAASCQKTTGKVAITLLETASGAAPGSAVPITFSAGLFTKTYPGKASAVDEMSGSSHPSTDLTVADPLWQAIIKESALTVLVPGQPPFTLSLKGSAAPARQFLALCSPAPVIVEPATPPPARVPGRGAVVAEYFCLDGSVLAVSYQGNTAVVSEPGAPPLALRWQPGGKAQRYVAGPARLINRAGDIRFTRYGEPARVCQPG